MPLLRRRILAPHQTDMLRYLKSHRYAALFVDMRLRKTLPVIRVTKQYKYILVVGPYSALYGWQEQIALEGLAYKLLRGKRDERLAELQHRAQYTLVSKEAHLVIPEIAEMAWDCIVLDESPFIKNYQSKVSKFYTENFRTVNRRIIMTGTPAPENELEYFQQLYFLDPGILGCKSWWEFRSRYFTNAIESERLWFISKRGRQFLGKQLAKHCFFLKRQDFDLGGIKQYETRKFELPENVRKIYDKVEKDFILAIPEEKPVLTKWCIQQFLWLRSLCSGSVQNKVLHKEKVNALLELLQGELAGQQVIIWCAYTAELIWLSESLNVNPVYGKVDIHERERLRLKFQRGESRYFLAQPSCFKHGTDLSAATTMVYFSSPLGRETREQSEDRFVDISKNDALLVIDLVAEKTVEEDIQSAMRKKVKRNEFMQEIVRACIARNQLTEEER